MRSWDSSALIRWHWSASSGVSGIPGGISLTKSSAWWIKAAICVRKPSTTPERLWCWRSFSSCALRLSLRWRSDLDSSSPNLSAVRAPMPSTPLGLR